MITNVSRFFVFYIIALCILAGNAPETALSAPPAECDQEIADGNSNEIYSAILTLQWGPETCCQSFSLRVVNNTGNPIELLWDKTFYIHNGTVAGGLVPSESGCSLANMPQTNSIGPGGVFETRVWPAPLVQPSSAPGICSHLPMDMGRNGVFLTVRTGGLEVSETVSLNVDYACTLP